LNSSQQLGEGLGGDDVGDDEWHTIVGFADLAQ
jgi:hypothetical protein